MTVSRFATLVLFLGATTTHADDKPAKTKRPPRPDFAISEETTYITKPLRPAARLIMRQPSTTARPGPGKDGYLFYSFGINGKDDGGRWYDDKPRADDLRVRMPRRP